MIRFTTGNILEAEVDAIVNTVNCVGVMGRGIALQFKNTFPNNFKAYAIACDRKQLRPGKMFIYQTGEFRPRYIINFPTKRHWKGKSRIEDIEAGLIDLIRVVKDLNIKSIAIPPLGSGLGGLNWSDVRPRIVTALESTPEVDATVYEPSGAPDSAALARNRKVPNMTAGRAALVVLMQRYLNGLMDPFVTLLEVHKLMFFMQEAGEKLRLTYRKANYGPYAENLRHVLTSIEGHLVTGYSDGGDDPTKCLNLVPGAFEDADRFLVDQDETRERFDRVAQLVNGFETPYGLELLSTVYWVAKNEDARSLADVQSKLFEWNERKRRFTSEQIALAMDVLRERRWLDQDVLTQERRNSVATAPAPTY